MMWCDRQMMKRLGDIGLTPLMYQRYVDDINTVSHVPPPGMRYRDGQVVIDTACVDEDLRMEDDERLFRLWKTIGDSIHPSIEVEVDFPCRYVDKSVPILDLRVWVEKMVDSDRFVVVHEFYMNNVSSNSVISARSALPWSVKKEERF